MDCDQLTRQDAPKCWRCGTETPHWLRVLPVPRSTDTVWCMHCFIEVHARFDDPGSEHPVKVEVDIAILLLVASAELPKVGGGFGGQYAPRLLREGWILEGGDVPVPEEEIGRLRFWWPRFMARLEEDLLS